MHLITQKIMINDRATNNLLKKETFALIFARFRKIMVQESFLENLNE